MKTNRYLALFLTFLKASSFTFAGGLAVVPAIEKDAVEKYGLLSKDEFMEYATLSQTMPGVIALNCATLVGRKAAGVRGMLAAGFGAIIPAFVLMMAATALVRLVPQSGPLWGAMRGVRAASAALLLAAAFSLGRYNLKDVFSVLLMLAGFVLVVFANWGAPLVILLAGMAGCVYQALRRRMAKKGGEGNDRVR